METRFFKVGDLVKVSNKIINSKYYNYTIGDIGVVIKDENYSINPYVKFFNGQTCCVFYKDIILLTEETKNEQL